MKIYDEPQFRHAMRNSDAADALRFIRGIHGSDTKAARAPMENFVSCWAGKPDNSKVTSKLTLKQRDEKLLVNLYERIQSENSPRVYRELVRLYRDVKHNYDRNCI